MSEKVKTRDSYMPDEATFRRRLAARHRRGRLGQFFYYFAIFIAILALVTLFLNVINEAFGTIAFVNEVDPQTLTEDGADLNTLDNNQLATILADNLGNRLLVLLRDDLSAVDPALFQDTVLTRLIPNGEYPDGYANVTIREIREEDNAFDIIAEIMALNLSNAQLLQLVESEVVKTQVIGSWTLFDTIFNFELPAEQQERLDSLPTLIEEKQSEFVAVMGDPESGVDGQLQDSIALRQQYVTAGDDAQVSEVDVIINDLRDQGAVLEQEVADLADEFEDLFRSSILSEVQYGTFRDPNEGVLEPFPDAQITRYHSWLDSTFLQTPMSSVPANAGIRTAIFGSILMMINVVIIALPIGVGAALYLNEYAEDNFVNRIIETNVRNLAGVPSIIYGMLGLAIFVRILGAFTSGIAFGIGAEVPQYFAIAQDMSDTIGVQVEFVQVESSDEIMVDTQDVASVSGNEAITQDEAQAVVNTFLYYGTPSLTNFGNLEDDVLANSLATDLSLELEPIEFPDDLGEAELAYLMAQIAETNDDVDLTVLNTDSYDALASTFRVTSATLQGFVNNPDTILVDELIIPDNAQEQLEPYLVLIQEATIEADRIPIARFIVTSGDISSTEFNLLLNQLQNVNSFVINGRTIVSAAATLALLILPIIIINAQEALRSVPYTIREASYGLGATKWQTIWRQVLPAALPGILTGTILSISRAVGETAPLIVVGASTFILTDPNGPFSKFTVLPIQVYQWTARPQEQFGDIAAAAIIVLLTIMLSLNAIAIFLRNRYSIKF